MHTLIPCLDMLVIIDLYCVVNDFKLMIGSKLASFAIGQFEWHVQGARSPSLQQIARGPKFITAALNFKLTRPAKSPHKYFWPAL